MKRLGLGLMLGSLVAGGGAAVAFQQAERPDVRLIVLPDRVNGDARCYMPYVVRPESEGGSYLIPDLECVPIR